VTDPSLKPEGPAPVRHSVGRPLDSCRPEGRWRRRDGDGRRQSIRRNEPVRRVAASASASRTSAPRSRPIPSGRC